MESKRRPVAWNLAVTLPLVAGVLVAAMVFITSRFQLADGGPGVLLVTVPVPAVIIFLAAVTAAFLAGSFRVGLMTGSFAFLSSTVALLAVLAAEGAVWMDRHGVFMLDGDPPRGPVNAADIMVNIFTTGMWIGHVIVWLPGLVLGAAMGAWVADRWALQGKARPRTAQKPA